MLVAVATLCLGRSYATADPSDGSSRTFHVIEFNFCGSDCPYPLPVRGPTDRAGGDTVAKLTELETQITHWRPNVVVLNEICLSQLERLVTELSATPWPMNAGPAIAMSTTYDGAHPPHDVYNLPIGFSAIDHRRASEPMIPRKGCDRSATTHARTFGNAVLVEASAPLTNRQEIPINVDTSGNPKGIQKGLCVTLADPPYNTRVCTAHTSPDPELLAPQQIVYFYDSLAHGYGEGLPEIIAGDLNVRPSSAVLDLLYDPAHGGTGGFLEADQCEQDRPEHVRDCDENTKDNGGDGNTMLSKKIDYMFASKAYFEVEPSATTVDRSPYSDHGILRGSMTECSTSAPCGDLS